MSQAGSLSFSDRTGDLVMAKKAQSASRPQTKRPRPAKRPVRAAMPALERLQPHEQALVLRALLAQHPELQPEAEALAAEMLSTSSATDVAEDICALVSQPDIDELNARAGDHGWGYVAPEEAADEILREAIADYVSDLKRKATAGFVDAAAAIGEGIILGLYQARNPRTGSVLDWSPDFPLDAAESVIGDLRRAVPGTARDAVLKRVVATVTVQAPEWATALERATRQK